jgi:hypothetical protein
VTAPDPDQMQERLDDLQEGTDAARRQAEEHGTIEDTTPEQTFIDPDADGRIDDEDEDPGTTFAT